MVVASIDPWQTIQGAAWRELQGSVQEADTWLPVGCRRRVDAQRKVSVPSRRLLQQTDRGSSMTPGRSNISAWWAGECMTMLCDYEQACSDHCAVRCSPARLFVVVSSSMGRDIPPARLVHR